MKRLSKRHASQTLERTTSAEQAVCCPFPPPDGRTRVELDLDPSTAIEPETGRPTATTVTAVTEDTEGTVAHSRHRARVGPFVSIGFAGVVAALCSTVAGETGIIDVPMSVEIGVGAAGVLLLMAGGATAWRQRTTREPAVGPPTHVTVEQVDLPTITGQMSGLLASLRREHGLAYTSGTWVSAVLPQYTSSALADPVLARDLLAAAALDAGGIRANVSTIAESYSRSMIVDTCVALLGGLEAVQVACETANGETPLPQPSDPTGWPAEIR